MPKPTNAVLSARIDTLEQQLVALYATVDRRTGLTWGEVASQITELRELLNSHEDVLWDLQKGLAARADQFHKQDQALQQHVNGHTAVLWYIQEQLQYLANVLGRRGVLSDLERLTLWTSFGGQFLIADVERSLRHVAPLPPGDEGPAPDDLGVRR
jgi:hypothetical protein